MYFYFSTVIAFAALPFLVDAVPVSSNSSGAKGPISLPLTKYSNHLNEEGHVDPRKVQAGVDQTRAKYDRAFSEHEKRTGEIHPLALKRRHSNERRSFQPISTNFTDFSNTLWTVGVKIGTPPVEYNLQLDTFSTNIFLCGASCLTCFAHKRYDPSQSSTSSITGSSETVNFSLGSVTGEAVEDNIAIGTVGQVNITQMSVTIATKIDIPFQATSFLGDGSMGFGLNPKTWFGILINNNQTGQNALPSGQQVFGMALSESGPGPELIIGGTDNTRFSGQLTKITVTKNAMFWQIPLDSVIVNGVDIKISNKQAVIDSGSTVVAGDSGDIANLYKNIPGSAQVPNSDQWTVPCNTTVDVILTFGRKNFTIPPDAYILGPVSQNVASESTENICMSGFSSGSDGFWSVGTVFMQTVYTQYDQQKFEIGFGVLH